MDDEEDKIEDTGEQPLNSKNKASHLQPWQFKKGQSGNPSGRKAGESLKEYSRRFLACMTDEEKDTFMEGLSKDKIWAMAEGNPEAKTDITSNGEGLAPILVEFINAKNNTNPAGV